MRQQKNCSKCGNLVDIIPAGVSKKPPYKPYGSFTKCKACNNSEKIGVQPSYPQNQANPYPQQNNAPERSFEPNNGVSNTKLVEHINKLADRVAKLEDLVLGKVVNMQELPVHNLPPLEELNVGEELDPSKIPF